MSENYPLIFRPSHYHRVFAVLLFIGSWMVGIRGLAVLIDRAPKLMSCIRLARLAGEPAYFAWACIVGLLAGCLIYGFLMTASVLGLTLIEGTVVTVDTVGISVCYELLPRRLATYFGAGYLPWNKVIRLEKHGVFFILHGEQSIVGGISFKPSVKFIVVQELERLVLIILEYGRNITLP